VIKIVLLSLLAGATAHANLNFVGKDCGEKNVESFLVEVMNGHQATKDRVADAKKALKVFNKYKWDVYFLGTDSDLKTVENNLTPFLPYILRVALDVNTDVESCFSKECHGASSFTFNTYDAGIICMDNKILAVSKTFHGTEKNLPNALQEKYGKSVSTKEFKVKQTQSLSSPTKERILKATTYKQGSNSILQLNDVSYLQNGTNHANDVVYYFDEGAIREIYARIKNLKSEVEVIRHKKRQDYDQKRKDDLKDKI
jgi:hypothetical protein